LILTVHDELVTLTPDHLVEQTTEAIREAMEDLKIIPIPLIADISVVQRWGDAK
jgi:DNA polymerase I-like protein with 3'-5' exonuclease and polymerase domains